MAEQGSGEVSKVEKTKMQEVIGFLIDLIIIIAIVIIVRTFFILPFQISGQSMYESYYDAEFIIVDRLSYLTFWEPKRWDVVVFDTYFWEKQNFFKRTINFFNKKNKNPDEMSKYFIKRVIWLPGETLKIQSGSVFIKSVESDEFIELDESLYLSDSNKNATYVQWSANEVIYEVPDGEYFVMWDNRNASTDSRSCFSSCAFGEKSNFIPQNKIVGKVFIDLWYFSFKTFSFMNPNLGIDTHPRWFSSPASVQY